MVRSLRRSCDLLICSNFSAAEEKAIDAIVPYIFFAFKRYRCLVETDFFTLICHDEFIFGILTTDKQGRITFMNETARQLMLKHYDKPPPRLPRELIKVSEALDAAVHSDTNPCLIFREVESYVEGWGTVVAYRFDQDRGGKYLPVKGEGWAYIIDPRVKDVERVISLSKRELEVVRLIGRGLQDKEIAQELGLAEKTIQTYINSIFDKLDTQNRTEAAVKAIRLGLISK